MIIKSKELYTKIPGGYYSYKKGMQLKQKNMATLKDLIKGVEEASDLPNAAKIYLWD